MGNTLLKLTNNYRLSNIVAKLSHFIIRSNELYSLKKKLHTEL